MSPVQYTPILGLPYPQESDPADVPVDVGALAQKLDTTILPSGDARYLQPGDLVVSAAASRAGCLLCDGSAVLRTGYPALFAAIGTFYGAGDGSTTFALPDYRGRTIVGAGAGPGLTPRGRGDQLGAETHSHSIPGLSIPGLSIPDLNLFASAASHTHTLSTAGGAKVNVAWGTNQITVYSVADGPAFTSGHGHVVGSSGGYDGGSNSQGSAGLVGATDGNSASVSGVALGASQNKTTGTGTTGGGTTAATSGMPPSAVANVFVKT